MLIVDGSYTHKNCTRAILRTVVSDVCVSGHCGSIDIYRVQLAIMRNADVNVN